MRPLRGILCTFAAPHETPEIVPFAVDGIEAGTITWGHRFLAPEPIDVRRYEDYVDALFKAKVVLDADGARRSSARTRGRWLSREVWSWSRTRA